MTKFIDNTKVTVTKAGSDFNGCSGTVLRTDVTYVSNGDEPDLEFRTVRVEFSGAGRPTERKSFKESECRAA